MCTFGGGERREFPSVGFYFTSQASGSVSSRAGMESREEGRGKAQSLWWSKASSKEKREDCEAVSTAPWQSEARNLK